MSREEVRRLGLFESLLPTIGREAATMLVDELPQAGLEFATRGDIAALGARIGALETRIDDRLGAVRDELLAAFRGELVVAVQGQTRQVIVATATAVFGIGGLAVTLAQVL